MNRQKTVKLAFACTFLFICLIILFSGCSKYSAEDPNWKKTHVTLTSTKEAVNVFGNDLLFDKLALKAGYSKPPYTEYILAYTGKNGGSTKDRQTWRMLSAQVNYGGERFSVDEDYVALNVFFKENDRILIGSEKYPNDGYENLLAGSRTTKVIHETTINYRETAYKDFSYEFYAEFQHKGYTYFLITHSKANPNLSWDTVNQMLT